MEGQIQQRNDRFLFLDSSGASFASESKYVFVFPKSVYLGPPHSSTRVVVSSFTGFASQYNINGYNNQLRLIIQGTLRVINVTPGQYDTITLSEYLNAQVAEVDVTYDIDQVKFVLTSANPFTLSGDSTILTALGFQAGTSLTGTVLQSTRLINLSGSRHIELQSSLISQNVKNADMSTLTLCRIPLANYQFGDQIFYEPYPLGISIKDHSLTYLSLSFTDSDGNPYSFSDLP
jgi:hypothetical protein